MKSGKKYFYRKLRIGSLKTGQFLKGEGQLQHLTADCLSIWTHDRKFSCLVSFTGFNVLLLPHNMQVYWISIFIQIKKGYSKASLPGFWHFSGFSALLEAEISLTQWVAHLHYLLPKGRLIKYLEKIWVTKQAETTSSSGNLSENRWKCKDIRGSIVHTCPFSLCASACGLAEPLFWLSVVMFRLYLIINWLEGTFGEKKLLKYFIYLLKSDCILKSLV